MTNNYDLTQRLDKLSVDKLLKMRDITTDRIIEVSQELKELKEHLDNLNKTVNIKRVK